MTTRKTFSLVVYFRDDSLVSKIRKIARGEEVGSGVCIADPKPEYDIQFCYHSKARANLVASKIKSAFKSVKTSVYADDED